MLDMTDQHYGGGVGALVEPREIAAFAIHTSFGINPASTSRRSGKMFLADDVESRRAGACSESLLFPFYCLRGWGWRP